MALVLYGVCLLGLLIAPSSGHLEGPSLKNQLQTTQDFDTFPIPPISGGNELKWLHVVGTYNSTGRNYSAYFATFHPSYFSFLPTSPKGCVSLIKPSVASNESWSNCEFATNGGFFDTNADNLVVDGGTLCHGNLISSTSAQGAPLYSQVPTDNTGSSRANFGITADGLVVTGFIETATIQNDIKFSNLLTGWGWVVRGGVSNVAKSQDFSPTTGFVTEKAPRTAVGVMPSGLMCLLEIDGQEDIKAGPDLYEQAELLVSLGVASAVNIDGGGSSVSVSKGTVVDYPTSDDNSTFKERAVASMTCVRRG